MRLAAMSVAAGLRWSGAVRQHDGGRSEVAMNEANLETTGIVRGSEHVSVEKSGRTLWEVGVEVEVGERGRGRARLRGEVSWRW